MWPPTNRDLAVQPGGSDGPKLILPGGIRAMAKTPSGERNEATK